MKALPSNRLLELDALRGIAVILVICFHLTIGREQANYGFKLGVTGSDLFFIISGFVISLTLERNYNWKNFVVGGFSRLYPAYWICVTFTTMLVLIEASLLKEPWKSVVIQYLANMTMFQTYFRVPDIDEPYWTLIVEMLFYFFILRIFLTKKIMTAVNQDEATSFRICLST